MVSSSNELLFRRNENPYDVSWEEWTALWCIWLLSIPRDKNPSVDVNGENCAENQSDPRVWFLGGTFGNYSIVKRKCTVPVRRAILFPILEKEDSFIEDSDLKSEEDLAARASRAMDAVTFLSAKIDGIEILNLMDYRVRSSFFNVSFPENNVYDVKPCVTRSVCDGYWIFIRPLAPGIHYIHFRGECLMRNGEIPTARINSDSIYSQIRKHVHDFHTFKVEVSYDLTVQ